MQKGDAGRGNAPTYSISPLHSMVNTAQINAGVIKESRDKTSRKHRMHAQMQTLIR